MGSQYVNDFDFNNRSYRVYVQADQQFRRQPRDLRQFYVRSDNGMMVPLDNLVTVKETTSSSDHRALQHLPHHGDQRRRRPRL